MTGIDHLATAERFTVFGANGFVGSHLVRFLDAQGAEVTTPARAAPICGTHLGHVIYAIGLTADFRNRPYDTMTAHVSRLTEILERARYDSFLYLSSTRVYARAANGQEDAITPIDVHAPGDLYNISKLAGESLCVNHAHPAVRVARLSNVFGQDMMVPERASSNFLASIIRTAVCNGHVELGTSPNSSKDFIHIEDVVRALVLISLRGEERLYNIAAGENVTHATLMDAIARLTGCTWSIDGEAPYSGFPPISTALIARSFEAAGERWSPSGVIDTLPTLIPQTVSPAIPAPVIPAPAIPAPVTQTPVTPAQGVIA
ncbi:MAG: nucleoside-diphosphate-sugar epimerase [Alphaproteobacteria bacterium]|jgi:nucleoside-diphosphate-sugar epimerase